MFFPPRWLMCFPFTPEGKPADQQGRNRADAPGPGSLGNAGAVTTAASERSGLALGPCADGNRGTGTASGE